MDKSQVNGRVIDAINDVLTLHPELTKAALAELCGVKPAKFSEILNLRMNAGVEIMSALCIQFNISADWLLTARNGLRPTRNYVRQQTTMPRRTIRWLRRRWLQERRRQRSCQKFLNVQHRRYGIPSWQRKKAVHIHLHTGNNPSYFENSA